MQLEPVGEQGYDMVKKVFQNHWTEFLSGKIRDSLPTYEKGESLQTWYYFRKRMVNG
jgi:hypothetical protein